MIKLNRVWIASILWFITQLVFADDPVLHSVFPIVPAKVLVSGGPYHFTYTFTNNLNKKFKLPFVVGAFDYSPSEFSFDDQCTGKKLAPNESCTFEITLSPHFAGIKTLMLSYRGYDHNVVNFLAINTEVDQTGTVVIIKRKTTKLPPTMIPFESAPYVFKFSNIGTAPATGVTTTSMAPGFASTCGSRLNPGSYCTVSGGPVTGNFIAAPSPVLQEVTATFAFAEGTTVSDTSTTQVNAPTSGIVGTVSTPLGTPLPLNTFVDTDYTVVFTFTNYEPASVTFAVSLGLGSYGTRNPGGCGTSLPSSGSCSVTVTFHPLAIGRDTLTAQLIGSGGAPDSTLVSTSTTVQMHTISGLRGVDYNPSHYPADVPTLYNSFNNHDVFYTSGNPGVSNVNAELLQLQAAGFTTVRSYQVSPYSWIDIINQAHAVGMKVVYEGAIPLDGGSDDIALAEAVLQSVINEVTPAIFKTTVTLVFAGHENYNGSNVNYLVSAVQGLQATLTFAGITNVPVGSALVGGDLITPSSIPDMTLLIDSYSATAPLSIDVYPFQYGVTTPSNAVWIPPLSTIQLVNSLSWDYMNIVGSASPQATPHNPLTPAQPFYVSPREILMAETGWSGTSTLPNPPAYYYPPGYACNTGAPYLPCDPGVTNAATYLTELYTSFLPSADYPSSVLVFEAYDEPTKGGTNINSAENFYGLFDYNCVQKAAGLVPANVIVGPPGYPGCQGYVNGALLHINGTSATAQPPFTVEISYPSMIHPSITVEVPTGNHSNMPYPFIPPPPAPPPPPPPQSYFNYAAVTPWPSFLVYDGALVTMTGSVTSNVCTTTVSVSAGIMTFSPVICTPGPNDVGCSGTNCQVPAGF